MCARAGLPSRPRAAPGASAVLRSRHERSERIGEHGASHLCAVQPGERLQIIRIMVNLPVILCPLQCGDTKTIHPTGIVREMSCEPRQQHSRHSPPPPYLHQQMPPCQSSSAQTSSYWDGWFRSLEPSQFSCKTSKGFSSSALSHWFDIRDDI